MPIPTCKDCGAQNQLMLSYSDIYGACFQCQNCNADFQLFEWSELFVETAKETV